MFRYASRRFGLTLFIAAAVDTPRCVPTPLLPPILSCSPPSLIIISLSLSLFLPILPCRSLFLSFSISCSLYALQRLFSFSLQHTLMHIYIYRLLARRLARIAASAPDAHDSTLVPMLPTSAGAPLYPWICLFTAAAQFLVIYTSRASRPANVPSSGYAGIAKFFRRSNVASTMLQTIWKPRVSSTLLLCPSKCFHLK